MSIQKSELTLACQTLLPIIEADENFEYFAKEPFAKRFFSGLITTGDFSRVMSLLQQLSRKREPVSCIFHLRQKEAPSMLVLLNGSMRENHLEITLYDIATLDECTLQSLTYQKLRAADQSLLKSLV